MRIAPPVYDIDPDTLRESCEILWDPEYSRQLQEGTGYEDLWLGFHGRKHCWVFGVYARCAITESQGGVAIPTEHRDMVVYQSDWREHGTGEAAEFDIARMISLWTGLHQRTEERITKVIENATAEARDKKLGQGRAERRYILSQFKKQMKAGWYQVAGYTGILKRPERKRLYF